MRTRTAPDRRAVVLLGAEGCVELQGQGVEWVREVSNDPSAWVALARKVDKGSPADMRDLAVDGSGRPYFLIEVLPSAPPAARSHAASCVRVLRLRLTE